MLHKKFQSGAKYVYTCTEKSNYKECFKCLQLLINKDGKSTKVEIHCHV